MSQAFYIICNYFGTVTLKGGIIRCIQLRVFNNLHNKQSAIWMDSMIFNMILHQCTWFLVECSSKEDKTYPGDMI